jgi:hypothetical protein
MKVWNFKKQKIENGTESPGCNSVDGVKDYKPVFMSYKENGENRVISIKDNQNETDRK